MIELFVKSALKNSSVEFHGLVSALGVALIPVFIVSELTRYTSQRKLFICELNTQLEIRKPRQTLSSARR